MGKLVNKQIGDKLGQYWNEELKKLKEYEKINWGYYSKAVDNKAKYSISIKKEYSVKLNDICKNNNLMIYTFLVSALNITLSKFFMNKNVLIGIPYYSSQGKNIILNSRILPLISFIDYDKTYLEYMNSIKSKILELYRNQSYLTSKILLDNDLSNNLIDFIQTSIGMKGLHQNKDIKYLCESNKSELFFLIDCGKSNSINIDIIYNTSKIPEYMVNALCKSYITIIRVP